jgi:hypothetical protein
MTFFAPNTEFLNVTAAGTHSYRSNLRGEERRNIFIRLISLTLYQLRLCLVVTILEQWCLRIIVRPKLLYYCTIYARSHSREKWLLALSRLSICPPVLVHYRGSLWTEFLNICYWGIPWDSAEKINICLKTGKYVGYFYMTI